ncbi:hypothetical protein CF327_g189 [Tilletia walkeri]|nr:hypothetical protein CF327_g189 [Tilletia walkeri]
MTSILTLSQGSSSSSGSRAPGASSTLFSIPGFEVDPILADSDEEDDDVDGAELFGLMQQQTAQEQEARNAQAQAAQAQEQPGPSQPAPDRGAGATTASSDPPQQPATPSRLSQPTAEASPRNAHASQQAGPSRLRLSASPVMDESEAQQDRGVGSREVRSPARLASTVPTSVSGDDGAALPAEANAVINLKTEAAANEDDDDEIILTAVKEAPRARPSANIAKTESEETSLSGAGARAAARSGPTTAAQRFFAGHMDLHDRDSRAEPLSALDYVCSLLTNADLVSVACINSACNRAAASRIYSHIEINGPNHHKLQRVLLNKPALLADCEILRIWHDKAITPADSPDQHNMHHRLEWPYVRDILRQVDARSEKEDLEFQVLLGMSQLQPLVNALQGEAPASDGCPRLSKALRKLTVIEDVDWNQNSIKHRDAWRGLLHMFEHLGGTSRSIRSVQELHILSHDDYRPREGHRNRSAPFLWASFGHDDRFAYSWPALRQLSLVVRDAKHFRQLNDIDLPNLVNLTIDAGTQFVDGDWSVAALDELLGKNENLESLSITLTFDHQYEGDLFSSTHPRLKFLLFHGPEHFAKDFNAFLARHRETLVSLDAGAISGDLQSLRTQKFPLLRLLDLRHLPDDFPLEIPSLALAQLACPYDSIRPKALRGPKAKGNGPSVKPSGAGSTSGKPKRNPDGSDVNPNTISSGIRLLDAEIPPAICIETMQSLTSLELTMSPYRFSEFTMESSMVISSRIFPNLLELKILGERPIEDKASLFLKKTPFQQFLVGLSDALALRAITIENFCNHLPEENFLGPLCPFGPALEFVLVRPCGTGARAWRIIRSIPESAGTRQVAGIGDSAGREYAVNRPVIDVSVVPVDDFHFSTIHDTSPADAWKELSFFQHWNDVERKRILRATKEAAMIGVVPGAETHPVTGPGSKNWGKAEAGDTGSAGASQSQTQSPSPSKRAASQRTAAAKSNAVTSQMFAFSQPLPRTTRAYHRKTELERAHRPQGSRPGPSGLSASQKSSGKVEVDEGGDGLDPLNESASELHRRLVGDARMSSSDDERQQSMRVPQQPLARVEVDSDSESDSNDDRNGGFNANRSQRSTRTVGGPSTSGKQAPAGFQPHPSPINPSRAVFTQAGPSRIRRRSSGESLSVMENEATPRATRVNGHAAGESQANGSQTSSHATGASQANGSQPSGRPYEPSGRPSMKKARNAGRPSIGTNGLVIPRLVNSSMSPEAEKVENEKAVYEAARDEPRQSHTYRGANMDKSVSPSATSRSSSPSKRATVPPRKSTVASSSAGAGPRTGSGFPPGAGKSLEVAMKIHQDVVDLTSSPEPEDAAGSRRRVAAAEAGPSAPSLSQPTERRTSQVAKEKSPAHPVLIQPSSDEESDGFEILG